MSTAPATSGSKVNYGMRLTSNRMTLMTGVVVFALLGYSIPSNMLTPLLVELQVAYNISAVAAIWISLAALLAGAAFVPTLCRLGDDLGWKKSMSIVALAAAFAAVYLVTYWSGFRGGDRAMVRRPAIEGAEPVSVAD
jgi:MFS family permease